MEKVNPLVSKQARKKTDAEADFSIAQWHRQPRYGNKLLAIPTATHQHSLGPLQLKP